MTRTEIEWECFTPMEKLKKKYDNPNSFKLPWYREIKDDGKLNKYASGRIEKIHNSFLNPEEIKMWENAPRGKYCGMLMTDKQNNVFWVSIENGKLYQGFPGGTGIGGFNPGFTKGR